MAVAGASSRVADSLVLLKLAPELSVPISGNDENGSEKMSALHSSRLAGDDSPVTKDSSEPKAFDIPLPKELEQEEELDSVSHELSLKGRDSSGKCSGAVSVLAMGAAMKELAGRECVCRCEYKKKYKEGAGRARAVSTSGQEQTMQAPALTLIHKNKHALAHKQTRDCMQQNN